MSSLDAIVAAVMNGEADQVQTGVREALLAQMPAEQILKDGLVAAMTEVGRLFEEGEFFVPEMLVSARAMQAGLALLKPHLTAAGAPMAGKVLTGTVKGDLHDIGKNLVGMMLEGAGFEIIDLGTDVTPEKFLAAVQAHTPELLAMSALLTTTMPSMSNTIRALEEAGIRDRVKIMVGGAPLTADFAKSIGADGYSPDASSAVRLAKSLASA